jgi:ubiquinone/menaquinone biosynthesis C-methylase UbiE
MGLGHPIYARIYDYYMLPQQLWLRSRRRRVVGKATGKVLELGVGTGLNLPLYRSARVLVAIEPDCIMLRRAYRRAREARVRVRLIQAKGEALPFPDESFDTIIVTLVLATIPDPAAAARELYRVLKREGTFRFLEHYRSENLHLVKLQDAVTPVWRRILGGCEPNRDILSTLGQAGFDILRTNKLRGTFLLDGVARRAKLPDSPTVKVRSDT